MEKNISYNYKLILKNLGEYLPSKGIVMLNSFFIIPILTYFLNVKEVSEYIIALQILNIFCTCSSDWISKALLRFYEKYSLLKQQDVFISTIFKLSVLAYTIACTVLFIFHKSFLNNFALNSAVLFLIGILLIPCAIRQNLYQILRIKNNYNLYTISIIIYQLIFVILFVAISGLLPNACGIIISMISAIFVIDVYILKTLPFKYKLNEKMDFGMLKEILKYGLPLILTNACYWFVFNSPKFIFQAHEQYIESSVLGLGWTIVYSCIEPIAGLFIFVNFPILIKFIEHNKNIKAYFTNVVQLYLYLILPIVYCLYKYSADIVKIILPDTYSTVKTVLPVLALIIFFHQLLKLITIKYHLQNKTYLETIFSASITFLFALACFLLIGSFSINKVIYLMLSAEILFFIVNVFIKLKNTDLLDFSKIIKTALCLLILCIIISYLTDNIFFADNTAIIMLKIVIFFVIYYLTGYGQRKYILN